MLAITRPVSTSLARCELTYLSRQPIDLARARRQHAAYEDLLASLGFRIERLPALDDHPDAVFVEDAGIALDEIAIVAPMAAPSRTPESRSVEEALAGYLPVARLTPPAMLDGGDVLRAGRRLFVGLSQRTNLEAVRQLTELTAPYGYATVGVPVHGALHLKSACTLAAPEVILANPDWVDTSAFGDLEILRAAEPWGASVLRAGETIVMPSAYPLTAAMLRARGWTVAELDLSELQKAEGGPTCLSILMPEL